MMVDPILIAIVTFIIMAILGGITILAVKDKDSKIDDLLIVAKMRDTYVAELQRRMERIELRRRLEH